ncbi:MAG TPA: hypothetical protein VH597_12670 [Verrucomicrobiae bacterium]|nr:hypothetical protein [Verrucomicrobiae bacterium]
MNDINKEEVFSNLKSFLKSKGIEIQDGSYAAGIRKGCEILTDTVNLSQRALVRAKGAMDKGLDQVRQTVHERTAPKTGGAKAKEPASAKSKNKTRPKTNTEKKRARRSPK